MDICSFLHTLKVGLLPRIGTSEKRGERLVLPHQNQNCDIWEAQVREMQSSEAVKNNPMCSKH